jgi:hypothetical protein
LQSRAETCNGVEDSVRPCHILPKS